MYTYVYIYIYIHISGITYKCLTIASDARMFGENAEQVEPIPSPGAAENIRSISEISSCFFWPRPWHIEIRHRVKKTSNSFVRI